MIWVSLADLKTAQSLEDYLQQNWLERAKQQVKIPANNQEDLRLLFASRRVFLLLDGADEMPVRIGNPLEVIVRQLATSEWISQARILLTCRVNVWEANQNILQNFDVYRHLDFSDRAQYGQPINQVEAFISGWFNGSKQQRKIGLNLRQELEQEGKQKIKDLTKNPLRLSLLCLVWEEQGRLPDTKTELYQQFVEEIYKWKQQQLKLDKSKIENLNKKLAELAKQTLDQKNILPRQKLSDNLPLAEIELLSPFRISHVLARLTLGKDFDLALKLGWLNQVGVSPNKTEEPIYAFLHPSFQEYFAAQAIAFDQWNYFLDSGNEIHRVFEQKWREVILFWFGRPSEKNIDNKYWKESFITRIWKYNDFCKGFYAFKARLLTAEALGEFRDCSDEIAEKIIAEVVKFSICYYIDENDFSLPEQAIRERGYAALLQINSSKFKDYLVKLLSRLPLDHIVSRSEIADVLAQLDPGNQEAINTHLDLIKTVKTGDYNFACGLIRYSSMKKIQQIAHGNAVAIKELKQLLYRSQDEHERARIATTLVIIASKEIAEKGLNTLIELLYNCLPDYVLSYLDYFEMIAINNFDPDTKIMVVERLTKLLNPIEYRQLPSEWKLNRHKIPWYENSSHQNTYSHLKISAFTQYLRISIVAALSLLKIQPEHKAAVRTLVEFLAIDPNKYPLIQHIDANHICQIIAYQIENSRIDNQTLINTLSEYITTIDDQDALLWSC